MPACERSLFIVLWTILPHVPIQASSENSVYIFSPPSHVFLVPKQPLLLIWSNNIPDEDIRLCTWEHSSQNQQSSYRRIMSYDAIDNSVLLNETGKFEFVNPLRPCTSGIWSSYGDEAMVGFYRMNLYKISDKSQFESNDVHVSPQTIQPEEQLQDKLPHPLDCTAWMVAFAVTLVSLLVCLVVLSVVYFCTVRRRQQQGDESHQMDTTTVQESRATQPTVQESQGTQPAPLPSAPVVGAESLRPEGCSCMNCREFPTDKPKCCGKEPGSCVAESQIFQKRVMETVIRQNEINEFMRKKLYTACSKYFDCEGQLEPLPSCCLWEIRDKYPDPDKKYGGFWLLKKCETCGKLYST